MEKNNITIGIEGLVGAGKTSLCRELLDFVPNSIILHGGNLYRGIIVAVMNSNINFQQKLQQTEHIDIKKVMDLLHVEVKIEDRQSVVYVEGKKIEEKDLQSAKASMEVSKVALNADNEKLYVFAKKLIDNLKREYNVIISGRDLMKIYPELNFHFFVIASLDERVKRKAKQYCYNTAEIEELREHIKTRDELQEKAGFYKRYENTIDIDVTECKSARESAEKVFERIKEEGKFKDELCK